MEIKKEYMSTLRNIGIRDAMRTAWDNLYNYIADYLTDSHDITYIICPFINTNVLEDLLRNVQSEDVVILTSWKLEHIMTGVSDIDLYQAAQNHGWTLYISDYIHAKIYSRDLKTAIIGSANITNKAIKTSPESNIEILTTIDVEREMSIWIRSTILNSKIVNDEIYKWYSDWVGRNPVARVGEYREEDIPESKSDFLISHLPATASPSRLWELVHKSSANIDVSELSGIEHDIALYNIDINSEYQAYVEALKDSFTSQPFMYALTERLSRRGTRFGKLKEWVQSICTDVPTPYRKTLTAHVQNIYRWLLELAPDEYWVTRPGHSQILHRRKD